MTIIRKELTFTGRVQGVGFRYRALYKAKELGLTGWVRNEWDGTVTMEVQGTEEKIERLIFLMKQERYIQIDGVGSLTIPAKEGERDFRIR